MLLTMPFIYTLHSGIPMDVDARGVKRGSCMDCACSKFERVVKNSSCGYCGCPPMKHSKIGKKIWNF